jgi:hypothetical protein
VYVCLDRLEDVRPLDLDRHPLVGALHPGPEHLTDGRRCDGLLGEVLEEVLHGPAQLGLQSGNDDVHGLWRDPVPEVAQLLGELLVDQVGAGGEHLAQLDEGGTQALQ